MVKLGVNIDHIATIRQARKAFEPDPVAAAVLSELAGADGITVHLREDRRHIQDRDVELLRQTVTTKLNLEMAVSDDIVAIALRVKPDDVCLVPEKRQELTTEGGLNVIAQKTLVRSAVEKLKKAGIRVNIFIDPDEQQVAAAHEIGANGVELHTGKYAESYIQAHGVKDKWVGEYERIVKSGRYAVEHGLTLNAGHGLDYRNVSAVAAIPDVNELNIGFSIIARAAFIGLDRAVREMKDLIDSSAAKR
jgi:pyridoxine 5-phosphate synthase